MTGSISPVDVVMDRDKSIAATFADSDTPQVVVLSPNGGEQAFVDSVCVIRWNAVDLGGMATVDILLYRSGLGGISEVLVAGVPDSGRLNWRVTGPPSANTFVRVVARDSSGNSGSDASNAAFTIRLRPTAVDGAAIADFALSPIVPNPARGRARIAFAVAHEARVRLSVHDVSGREVALLVDGVRPPGRHEVVWSGRLADRPAAAGVYFVRLEVPGRRFVRRAVLAP